MSFDTLGLSDKVVAAVKAVGYTTPTPIQAEAIPHVLQRRDVLGLAQTGTGKTASFTLPMLTLLEKGRARARMPRTLILEPTRELAAQVQDSFERYGVNHKLNLALLIGGVSFDEQDKKITRGADVLVATPGRLLDHFERGRLLLTGVEILVIDEADRMLDMGFIPDIERIVKLLPVNRQTLFFSATMPPEISHLADRFLQNPVRVEVSKPASTGENINQTVVTSGGKPHEKRSTLRKLIDDAIDLTNAIIFCNRKRDVATVYRSLEKHGYSVGALHGDMDQHSRIKMLELFREGGVSLLVASDVAARGLDIPAVSHIFNFDVPTHAEDYVHRIGRTGRAGRHGEALTILTRAETKYIDQIERLTGKPIPRVEGPAPSPDDGDDALAAPRTRGRRDDKRPRRERPAGQPFHNREASVTPVPVIESRPDAASTDEQRPAMEAPAEEAPPVGEAVDAPEARTRPSRRRRGQRSAESAPREASGEREPRRSSEPRQPRAESREPRAERPSEPRREARPQQPRRDTSPPQSSRPARQPEPESEDASRAVGFSDHVPAFLLRPVRLPKAEAVD